MSDSESYRSASPARNLGNTNPDEVLDDHRHQEPSLPVRASSNAPAASGNLDVPSGNSSSNPAPSSQAHPHYSSSAIADDSESDDVHRDSHHLHHHDPHHVPHHHDPHHVPHHHSTHHASHHAPLPHTPLPDLPRAYVTDPRGYATDTGASVHSSDSSRYYPSGVRYDYASEGYQSHYDPYNHHQSDVPFIRGTPGSLAAAARRGRTGGRSHSFSEQIKSLVHPKPPSQQGHSSSPVPSSSHGPSGPSGSNVAPAQGSILKNAAPQRSNSKKYKRAGSVVENLESDLLSPMIRSKTNDSGLDERPMKRERRTSRSSIDSDADSHASRSSQETEEDVCFPMLREHVRIKGIDFDEIEEFIKAEREEEQIMKEQQELIAAKTAFRVSTGKSTGSISSRGQSSAALKYTPKNILNKTSVTLSKLTSKSKGDDSSLKSLHEARPSDSSTSDDVYTEKNIPDRVSQHDDVSSSSADQVKFGGTKITGDDSALPDRFSFFSSESEETVHAPDIPSMVEPGQSVRELFRNGESTWWLDCICPTDAEMKTLAKAFGIHPLTAEDIRMQETREKVELFRNYYFVCFHTFEPDKESEDYLEPINVYLVVFRDGVLSFHFSPITHPANVRRRVRQLRDYVDVSADWICYALIDDITDGFAPVITAIEYEADAIEDCVFVARDQNFSNMLQRIGESRRKVMTLMRLLSGKADVIKMFAKRCQDEAAHIHSRVLGGAPPQGYPGSGHASPHGGPDAQYPLGFNQGGQGGVSFGPGPGASSQHFSNQWQQHYGPGNIVQPRADIALYLGDIQDHVVTMFQNLLAYEKIFSRSHSNYLAQLQVESFYSNLNVTELLSKVTIIGTVLVPLNLITGLFGMNVTVPGQDGGTLQWWFGILGVMVFIALVAWFTANFWLSSVKSKTDDAPASSKRSIKSFGMRRAPAKSILSFPNKYE